MEDKRDKHRKLWKAKIWNQYRIRPEDVARAFDKQGMRCAICRCKLDLGKGTHIDHDHSIGIFRGLLCGPCNIYLGRINENRDTLRRAIDYLDKSVLRSVYGH